MILADTNILSELMKPNSNSAVVEWMNQQPKSTLYVSAISRAEIERGIAILPDGKRKQQLQNASTQTFKKFAGRCLVFDEQAAIEYGQICAECKKVGRPISVEDAQIASIAIVHSLHLATRNVKDFESIPNLTIINPWQLFGT